VNSQQMMAAIARIRIFTFLLATFFAFFTARPAIAHENHCDAVKDSVESAGFSDKVEVTCEGDTAIIKSDTYPGH